MLRAVYSLDDETEQVGSSPSHLCSVVAQP